MSIYPITHKIYIHHGKEWHLWEDTVLCQDGSVTNSKTAASRIQNRQINVSYEKTNDCSRILLDILSGGNVKKYISEIKRAQKGEDKSVLEERKTI